MKMPPFKLIAENSQRAVQQMARPPQSSVPACCDSCFSCYLKKTNSEPALGTPFLSIGHFSGMGKGVDFSTLTA